jgi:uncharacterized protein (TIGR02466 family)
MIESINPFSPLIFKAHYSGFSELHLQAAAEILSMSTGETMLETGAARSSVSNQALPPHHHQMFADFFNWQDTIAQKIIKDHLMLSQQYDYVVGNSWVNLHGNTGKTVAHCHGLAALSTVAYIRLPDNSGLTEFKDPWFDLKSLHERSDSDVGLKEWASVNAIEGDVLFFPGWLQHRSQPSNSSNNRWILSSNYINFRMLDSLNLGNVLSLN